MFEQDKQVILAAEKKGIKSKDMFKALLKIYTGESLHKQFGMKLVAGKYSEIENYLTAYVDNLNEYSHLYAY
jgi:hypothetical protein